MVDHRLRGRRPDRFPGPLRRHAAGALHHPRAPGPRGGDGTAVRGQLFRSCAARPGAPVRAGAAGTAAASAHCQLSERTGRGRRALLGRVPAAAGRRGPLARRSAAGGLPGAASLARDGVRPAPARQRGLDRRYAAHSGNAGAPCRCRRTDRARLRAARQSLAQRHRRPRTRVPARAAGPLRALPLRQCRGR